MIKFKELYEKNNYDMFVDFNDRPTMNEIFLEAYENGFSFPNNQFMSAYKAWNYFYSYAHKNSKPVVHFCFNSITNKNEMQLTCRSIIKTYPQYQKAKIIPLVCFDIKTKSI